MNQSNAIRRTAITFGLAIFFALVSIFIQNHNQNIISSDHVEASIGNLKSPVIHK